MSLLNISNDCIKDRANNLKSTVKVLEQSLENDKQRREKISKEIVSLDQYCDKIIKDINTETNECKNIEIMIGFLESCEKCKVSESDSNFSFSQLNPLKFTEIELIGILSSKRYSMRSTPIELLQLKPCELLLSICDNYSFPELQEDLINTINDIYHSIDSCNTNNNHNNHIYVSEDELDPFTPICPFDLDGECTDIGCPFQHFKKTTNNTKKEEKIENNVKSKCPLIVIPIPKNYNFKVKRKYRIEQLNSQIPLYLKNYQYIDIKVENEEEIIKEMIKEINTHYNDNICKVPDSLQPELLLKYLFNLSQSNNIYDLYDKLKSNPNALVLIDYILKYISSILQSHRTVSYVWNVYLNFYFLRQWTNVQDILMVCKVFKDLCPFNVIGYSLIIDELSHWNIDSVVLLNYYLNTCKECSNCIINNNPNENDIDLTFNLIKQLIYYSYSIGYYDVINSLFSSIIKSNNNYSNYILDGGDIYYSRLINIFSISQISILFSLYLYFELYKQLPPYSITNFPFFVKRIDLIKTQSQISSLYQCYKTLNRFCNENELNKYEVNSYVDIYGLETLFYSYKWISELCQIEYNTSHLNILKKNYNLFYKIYKMNDKNENNKLPDEDIGHLKSNGYLSIITHYQLLNLKYNNKDINKDNLISLNDEKKNILHILLQWCNFNNDKAMSVEESIKYLYSKSIDAYELLVNVLAKGIMECVDRNNSNSKTNFNRLLNSVYTLEICCIIKNIYEKYINNNSVDDKYVDIIIDTLININCKIDYKKLLLISSYRSSIAFMFQIYSILFKSLSLFQCEIPISKWFNYIQSLDDKLKVCFNENISLYFELNKVNDETINQLEMYNLSSYYHLLYGNNNHYTDSYLSILFEIVKPYLNCNITEGSISITSNIPTYCLLLTEYLWNNNESSQIKELIRNMKGMDLFQFDSIIPSIVHYDLLYSIYERCSIYKLFDILEIYINYYPFQWKIWRYGMIVDIEYGDDQDSTSYLVKEFIQRSLFIDPR